MDSPPDQPTDPPPQVILAVDLGLRLGLALIELGGPIHWARSLHVKRVADFKKVAWSAVRDLREGPFELVGIATEGDRNLARHFAREAERAGCAHLQLYAETWRRDLLHQRERRSGESAKKHADRIAREHIARSGGKRPTSLRHDAAEAVLIGVWAAARWLEEGWDA